MTGTGKYVIDSNGFFVRDVFPNEDTDGLNFVTVQPPQDQIGFKAKWDGSQWINGSTVEELTPQPSAPSTVERLNAVESAISSIMGV